MRRIVVVSTGGWDSVSTQYRLGPLARAWRAPFEVQSARWLPERAQVKRIFDSSGSDAVLILQRVLPERHVLRALRSSFGALVFDFDDAIYAVPPAVGAHGVGRHLKATARLVLRGSRTASVRRRPLADLLREVDVCVAGNAVLARFARTYASRVVEIPTTIEPVPRASLAVREANVLVWMGLPDNLQYLELLRPALTALARRSSVRLRIVSSATWSSAPITVEHVPWSLDNAREALLTSSVGLSPLTDDPWTRGKCALRAIQYGAHALPTVASPVGITDQVVLHRQTGFLARTGEEWTTAVESLLDERPMAAKMGEKALAHVTSHYSDEVALRRWQQVMELAGRMAP